MDKRLVSGGIYPIVDADSLSSREADIFAEAVNLLSFKPTLMQIRAKSWAIGEYEELLLRLCPYAKDAGTLLIANDHVASAAAADCAGVHVGQSDCSVAEIRDQFPQLLVGLSTHNREQFLKGLESKPDYIALGPLFSTSSKKNPEPSVGVSLLSELAPLAEAAGIPLVIIGGINSAHFSQIAPYAPWVALISALLKPNQKGFAISGDHFKTLQALYRSLSKAD